MMKNLLKVIFIFLTLVSCLDSQVQRGPVSLSDYNSTNNSSDGTDDDTDTTDLPIPTRPSSAVIIESNQCACQAGEAKSLGNCAQICAEKSGTNDNVLRLFFEVSLTEAITLDTYEDLSGWCSTPIIDPNTNQPVNESPNCSMEFKDTNGSIVSVPITPNREQTELSLDLTAANLNANETYRVTLVENTSEARSTTVHLRLLDTQIEDNIGGPLAAMPVTEYTCMIRQTSNDDSSGKTYYDSLNRFHFYFIPATRPEPLKESTVLSSLFCHDIQKYGTTPINSPLLEEDGTQEKFNVWNATDPRFYNLDGDPSGRMKVELLLQQEMRNLGQVVDEAPRLFYELQWPSGINDGDVSNNDNNGGQTATSTINSTLGYYMTPFLDTNTYTAYCPTRQHYYSSTPLFKAMKEVVGLDTEALYAAKQDNACDFLLISETKLKKIWFYTENGQNIKPTDSTVRNKKIQFYWPADENSPLIKKGHQRVYTLKAANEINCSNAPSVQDGAQDSSGASTNYPTHDKRIGCIPSLN